MPTYEYRCKQGHHFELFQRISEAPVDKCPQCGAVAERLLSGAGLIFKGSGFYTTDYRSDTYKKAAEKDNGPPKSQESGPPKSQESGPPKSQESGGASGSSSAPESKPASGGSNDKPASGGSNAKD